MSNYFRQLFAGLEQLRVTHAFVMTAEQLPGARCVSNLSLALWRPNLKLLRGKRTLDNPGAAVHDARHCGARSAAVERKSAIGLEIS